MTKHKSFLQFPMFTDIMNSNLLGLLSIILGVIIMALTLVVIYNPFGNFALPSIVVGSGTLVAVLFLVIAFSGRR